MTWQSLEVTPPLVAQSVDRFGRITYGLRAVDYSEQCSHCKQWKSSIDFRALAKNCRQCESEAEGRRQMTANAAKPGVRPSVSGEEGAAFRPFSTRANAPARIPPREAALDHSSTIPQTRETRQTQPILKVNQIVPPGFDDYFGKSSDVSSQDITQPSSNPHATLKNQPEDNSKPSLQGLSMTPNPSPALTPREESQEITKHDE